MPIDESVPGPDHEPVTNFDAIEPDLREEHTFAEAVRDEVMISEEVHHRSNGASTN